jgi:hypothetical protein
VTGIEKALVPIVTAANKQEKAKKLEYTPGRPSNNSCAVPIHNLAEPKP